MNGTTNIVNKNHVWKKRVGEWGQLHNDGDYNDGDTTKSGHNCKVDSSNIFGLESI